MTSRAPFSLPEAIGDQLRHLRLNRFDLRQEDIAARARGVGLHWTQSTVAAIESGNRGLSLEEFFSLPLVYHPLQLADIFADDFEVEAHLREGAVWTAPSSAFRDMLLGHFTSEDPFKDVRLQRWGAAQVSARVSISADATVVAPAPPEARAEGGSRAGASPAYERVPPHNVEAEKSVLGSMLLSKDAIAEVLELLHEEDFYRPAHRTVFRSVLELYSHGQPIDAITVAENLRRNGTLADVGGAPFLHTLVAGVPTAANAGHYARIVKEAGVLRRLIDADSAEERAEPPSKVTVRKVVKLGQVVEEESAGRIVPLAGTSSAAASASGDLTVERATDRKVELSESATAADMLTVEVQPPRMVNLGPDAARAFRDLPPNIQKRLPEIAHAARSEAERKAARKFGVSPDLVSVVAFKRYHCSLSEERDNKVLEMQAQDQAQGKGATSRTIQALRGHATRKILAEMEGLIRHYAMIRGQRTRFFPIPLATDERKGQ